jgi:aspartate racemase
MKTLGLIGGTSWASTVDYYRLINQGINEKLGGHEFARCILYSLNFGDIMRFNANNDTEGICNMVRDATEKVVQGGAEGIVLCANTLHKFADRLQKLIPVPLIHIAEATAREIRNNNISVVGLLGTLYTMEEDFYISKLERANIRVMVPEKIDREIVNAVIYDELARDIVNPESKKRYLDIMDRLKDQGVQGIVLGCTEIPLLIKEGDFDLPLFNTTVIHARAAIDFSLGICPSIHMRNK